MLIMSILHTKHNFSIISKVMMLQSAHINPSFHERKPKRELFRRGLFYLYMSFSRMFVTLKSKFLYNF